MLINLWSTPRVGSVWTAFRLYHEAMKEDKNSTLVVEFFNRYHYNIYKKEEDGSDRNVYIYSEGCRRDEFFIENDEIKKTIVYGPHIRNADEEEHYRLSLLDKIDFEKTTTIFHNHIEPLGPGIYDKLFSLAPRNIFIKRNSLRDQLASFAVAFYTREFAIFKETTNSDVSNVRADHRSLTMLYDRIVKWEKLDKTGCEILTYEDIDFDDYKKNHPSDRFPVKQNKTSAFDKLSNQSKDFIMTLVKEHELSMLNK